MLTYTIITIAFCLCSILFTLVIGHTSTKRLQSNMQTLYGTSGFSPAWTASNGNRYKYDLSSGRIVAA
jgi:hypothetical protein